MIFRYSGEQLTNAIPLAFGAESGKLNKLSRKTQKVVAYLNDSPFWFGYYIGKVTEIKIFKHTITLVFQVFHFEKMI